MPTLCVECGTEIKKGKYCKSCLRDLKNQKQREGYVRNGRKRSRIYEKSHEIIHVPKGSLFKLGSRFWREEIESTARFGNWNVGTRFRGKNNGTTEIITIKERSSYGRMVNGLRSQKLDIEEEEGK
jgi:hypothetical protein